MPRNHISTKQEELEHIREDINSLKNNVVALTHALEEEVTDVAVAKAHQLETRGRKAVSRMEKRVKQNPGQSLLAAFGTGFLISAIMRRH